MKIEKISDNQIRCTLTKEDLDSYLIVQIQVTCDQSYDQDKIQANSA